MAAALAFPQKQAYAGVPVVPQGGRFRGTWNIKLQVSPEYKFVGYHVSAIPHPLYPWTESDVRLIRNYYDPDFVPLWRVMRYQTKAGAFMDFLHHGVARFEPNARPDPLILRVDMPTGRYGASFRHPNIVERWFENKSAIRPYSVRSLYQLPPPTIHWGPWVVAWVADTFWEATWQDKLAFNKEKERQYEGERDKRIAAEQAEADYRAKGEANYQSRQFDDIGVDERKEVIARQTGQWKEAVRPFADAPRGRFTGEQP